MQLGDDVVQLLSHLPHHSLQTLGHRLRYHCCSLKKYKKFYITGANKYYFYKTFLILALFCIRPIFHLARPGVPPLTAIPTSFSLSGPLLKHHQSVPVFIAYR